MTTIKAVSVRVFELFTTGGESLGLFKVDSEWSGMRKLKSLTDERVLIVDHSDGTFENVFGLIFGEHRSEMTVVKATPDLMVKL